MYFKYSINQNQSSDFRWYFFIRDFIKNVMIFFEKFVNYNANNVVFVRIKKIDDKVYNNILLTFVDHNNKN